MSQINILHLSDLQFGNKSSVVGHLTGDTFLYNRLVHAKVVEALVKRGIRKVDAAVFSGDAAEQGKPNEFEAALGFFSALQEEIWNKLGSRPPWVFCPGNHDVNRGASRSLVDAYGERRREGIIANFSCFVNDLEKLGFRKRVGQIK